MRALTDPKLRLGAAHRLGDLKASRAVPALVRNLHVHNDFDRNSAVKALGKIGDTSAVPPLIEVAEEDEAAGVRTTAIDSLAMLGDPRGVQMLAELALDPRPLFASTSRYFDSPLSHSIRPTHLRSTRRWAAKRLRQLGASEALPLLEASARTGGVRHRIRLRRTINALRKDEHQHR